MSFKKQIGQILASLILTVVLMLPAIVQFSHIFESHKHVSCTETKTHIHKEVNDCEICKFTLASFNYSLTNYPEFKDIETPISIENFFSSLLFNSSTKTNTQLRAPPSFFN